MKKVVWLIGDSIRLGYQDLVIEKLGDAYEVYKPDENGRFSTYTLNSLRWWTPGWNSPDIIHWNNGLWDINRCITKEENFTSPQRYVEDMGRLLKEFKKTGAKIIFATTTPTLHGLCDNSPDTILNEDVKKYNKLFLDHYGNCVDAVDDLFHVVYPHLYEYICEDFLHLSAKGKEVCADAVAASVRAVNENNCEAAEKYCE